MAKRGKANTKRVDFSNGFWVELPHDSQARKRDGYLWKVEVNLGEKRKRKFFRNGESANRDQYIAEMENANRLAEEDRGIVTDTKFLAEASKARKELDEHGKTLADAVEFYLSHLEKEAARDATLLHPLIEKYLEVHKKAGKRLDTLADLRQRLARFERAFPEKPTSSFTTDDIQDWLDSLNVGPQARVNQRRVLHGFFEWVRRRKVIEENPAQTGVKIEIPASDKTLLKPEQIARLLESADERMLPAIALQAFCGLRDTEAFRAKWEDFRWEKSVILVPPSSSKVKQPRKVHIPDNARQWIYPLAKRVGQIAPYSSEYVYRSAKKKLLRKAGFGPKDYPQNGLRRTFISCHYEAYESVGETAKQAGNSEAIILSKYHKLIEDKEDALRLWEIYPSDSEKIQSIA